MRHSHTQRAVAIAVAALMGAVGASVVHDAVSADPAATELPRSASLPTTEALSSPSADTPAPTATPGRRGRSPASLPQSARTTPPRTLTIPSLALALPVQPTGVDQAGLMALPDTVSRLGWYRFGPGPLDPRGATVIAGHVDTAEEGTGPLARLAALRAGDEIRVRVGGRDVRYDIVAVTRVAKSALDYAALFSRTGPPRLQLVTCGGAYLPDQGGYQDTVVVTARRSA
ncbi:MAG: sortase [Nocardioides sp.]